MLNKLIIMGVLLATVLFLPFSAFAEVPMLFSDVPQTSKFFIPAKYLKEQNLISGYNDGTFQPNNLVNRAEALAMVLKATGREIKTEESAHEKNVTA
ncbi:S-layer homology domain-containing protein, partial [Candidatus Peregrinibacteria bacterium]|nr:S-layer homology domain-containing protein [Candidatus Peregrinibacteria bacterium]